MTGQGASRVISNGPLTGVTVVDLTMAWAGPMAMRIIAELGADVIKIEAAQKMDRWRGGTFVQRGTERYPDHDPGDRPWNRNSYFNTQNIGKRGIALDLKSEAGKEVFRDLVARADMVAENFAAGAMGRLGLDFQDLVEIKPDIVMVSMPAFGRTGPEAAYIAHGPTIEEMAGNAAMQGYPGGPPQPSGRLAWGDPVAGINGALAAVLAIHHARTTGEGQHVDLSHVESAIPLNFHGIMDASLNQRDPDRIGNTEPAMVPHNVYPAAGDDKWVAIACRSDEEWTALAECIGRADLAADTDLATTQDRVEARERIDAAVTEWTSGREAWEAAESLAAAGVPAGPVLNAADLSTDRHLAERDYFVEVEHPEAGRHKYPGLPWVLRNRGSGSSLAAAPMFGEHNTEILAGLLGRHADEIRELEDNEVLSTRPLAQGD